MQIFLFSTICLLGTASYVIGVWQMLKNKYSPSTFSRVVWVLLAINSFAGVILSQSSRASVLLGGLLLLGNVAVCIVSFWKGVRTIGKLEYICLDLLEASGLIWIFFRAPLVNLGISFIA
ncbi:MAG: hypothetical protein AAB453_01460, partial [Patescibacteria group bacterium]